MVCGDLILDCTLRRARRGNMDIDLTVKEYRLLEYFLLHQRAVLSRLTLLRDVWDKNFDTNTNVVDVYVNYLRAKIDKGFEDKLIHTVVVHELCHRREMNHSQAFWKEVEKILPDYRERQKWLKDNGWRLMEEGF